MESLEVYSATRGFRERGWPGVTVTRLPGMCGCGRPARTRWPVSTGQTQSFRLVDAAYERRSLA